MDEVITMRYDSLQQMLQSSSSSRRYFLSLSQDMQMALHQHGPYIHTAQDLHRRVEAVEVYRRQVALSEAYGRDTTR